MEAGTSKFAILMNISGTLLMKNEKQRKLLQITSGGLIALGTAVLLGWLAVSPSRLAQVSEPKTPDIRVFQSEATKLGNSKTDPEPATPRTERSTDGGVKVSGELPTPTKGTQEKKYYVLADPNDTYYSSQWYLQTVRAPQAWSTTTGSPGVKVAVIDTGFALSHGDLTASWQYNSGEQGGGKETDGIDNDGNGYVDDYRGWDFFSSDNSPQAGSVNPSGEGVSHGTEVAGLVGAKGNNGVGVTAVSQSVSILPLQVLSDEGTGYSDDIANAIRYAVDSGVAVINMSLGTNGDDPIVRSAVDYAADHNVVVVAAAGNCGNSTIGMCAGEVAGYITFPGSYNRVIAVGATTAANQRASFSSYGERLDVVAPGSGTIISPTWSSTNGTSLYSSSLYGTSYASPIVASTAALIRSIRPSTSVDDVRALLMAGASKQPGMNNLFYTQDYGHGIVDVAKAIAVASELNASIEQTPSIFSDSEVRPQHDFGLSETFAKGCSAPPNTWCTVSLSSEQTNFERYFPYSRVGSDSTVSWIYNQASLSPGDWKARARQGNSLSQNMIDFKYK